MKRTVLVVVLAALLLATLACGTTTGSTGSGGGGTVQVTLVNNSGSAVCYVYISPNTETTWGNDWLGSSETIDSGSSRTFNVTPGVYDLRADDCNHNALAEEYGVTINRAYTWSIP